MKTLRVRAAVVLVFVLALGTGSCGGDETPLPRVPVSVTGGVGEPIRDGFRVVDGSGLIGPAFPIGVAYFFGGEPVIDGGFRAFFEVRGDPRDVINGYLDQARELGMSEGTAGDPVEGRTLEPIGRAWCGRDEGGDVFICSGFARNQDENNPRSLTLSLARGRIDGRSVSHLEMRYSTLLLHWQHGPLLGPESVGGAGTPDAPAVPEDLGQPISESALFDDWPPVDPVDVVDGSRPLLEMPSFFYGTTWLTPLAVLEVSADPETVMAGYADQFSTITRDDVRVDPPLAVTGGLLRKAHASAAGGVEYVARLFETDQGSWLLIDSGYD